MRIVTTLAVSALALGIAQPALADRPYQIETLAEGIDTPWGMAFLPGTSDIIMTGRLGEVMIYDADSGDIVEISGAPEVDSRGQGGLLDIEPAPDFAESQMLYMTWSADVGGGDTTTMLGRAVLDRDGGTLTDLEELFEVSPAMDSQAHYGSRIVFADGHVYVSLGTATRRISAPTTSRRIAPARTARSSA